MNRLRVSFARQIGQALIPEDVPYRIWAHATAFLLQLSPVWELRAQRYVRIDGCPGVEFFFDRNGVPYSKAFFEDDGGLRVAAYVHGVEDYSWYWNQSELDMHGVGAISSSAAMDFEDLGIRGGRGVGV